MKIALVYDHINKIGGAERILEVLFELYPNAPVYTVVYNPKTAPFAHGRNVITSFLQMVPFARTHHEWYPWATPFAFEQFNFDGFDIVISITSSDAKGIITKPETLHLCYCLTPTRYLWSHYETYFRKKLFKIVSLPMVTLLRMWDYIASTRPDSYIAISKEVAQRIQKFYRRDSHIIYPPVDINLFTLPKTKRKGDFYLVVSRLVAYKRIELALEACNELGIPLVIVGSGREEKHLKKRAQSGSTFLSNLTDRELVKYYQDCRALIFPGEEDLGLVAIEAQACGTPVIAYENGGMKEIVVEGKTGEFFIHTNKDSLKEAIGRFEKAQYKEEDCRENALRFTKERFKKEFATFVASKRKEFLSK